jgi:glutamine synthetase
MTTSLATGANRLDPEQVRAIHDDLADRGVRTVIGTTVNASGMTLGKSVPLARLDAFHRAGLGCAPAWQVFCIDSGIAFTADISAVGDLRLRLDIEAARNIGDGLGWGPANLVDQDGERSGWCARGLLTRTVDQLAQGGVEARVGHEMEFVLVAPSGDALDSTGWIPYGPSPLLEREDFLSDLQLAFAAAGISVEQLHAEYGANQYEFSLPPRPPVEAADMVVLAKVVIGRVARRHNVRASFSPVPFAGAIGNGAHQHFSLTKDGEPLFSGGPGPYGLSEDGASAIAGVLDGIISIQGLLTGSILSGNRIVPGLWSGAHVGWGVENREAAVRFLQGGQSNPYGSNFEVKTIDPSSNVYLVSAAVLALAHHGLSTNATLAPEIQGDPSKMTPEQLADAGIRVLPASPDEIITGLEHADQLLTLLTPEIVEATVAVRRYEQKTFAEKSAEELADAFRLAWSV